MTRCNRKQRTFWIGILFFLLFPIVSQAQTNAGFVQGVWYDRETLIAGEPTRIYAAIRNNTGADLTGTVEFYINDKRIERKNVSALNNRIIESWTDWTPSYGTSTIKAVIARTEITTTASGSVAVAVVSAETEDVVFVDYDTDGDGTPNQIDTDDDGDKLTDVIEIENGTDPLDANDPVPEPEAAETATTSTIETLETTANPTDSKPVGEEQMASVDGLEQFFNDSQAGHLVESFTNTINTASERLDTYRETRKEKIAQERSGGTNAPEHPESGAGRAVDAPDGAEQSSAPSGATTTFGEVSRAFSLETRTDGSQSFFDIVQTWLWRNLQNVFSFLLLILSFYLNHPMIVQLSLLFLILFIIYKLARRLGARTKK